MCQSLLGKGLLTGGYELRKDRLEQFPGQNEDNHQSHCVLLSEKRREPPTDGETDRDVTGPKSDSVPGSRGEGGGGICEHRP